ncbi:ribose 1,5-bisphosphokinase [Enterobacter sp. CC120223-11]|uniref:ribose 1,5-bisphosphokinase n=1 Tax=Enterobacter sp. CC120223-11 TaxID=1378073 RepID=UPI000BD667D0|nr:ribose 1,5-bisphosphokinase [Enterobacter sp. CC120223-11]SNY73359.1 ribose 1,5-bisphosphokinase [Enterobacter sp. CC120223-11]
MTGRLIWLVGPSGSGKDSLLAALRQREHARMLVAHRYITRPANAGSENHIALSEHEFFTRAERQLFALSWHANALYYGVGIEIDVWLHAGFDVVVNGSRAHLPQAKARYAEALLPVCLQVSPDVLRSRLEQRGRETQKEIAQRLDRAARYTPDNCLMLNNDGSLLQSVDIFLQMILTHGNQKENQHVL